MGLLDPFLCEAVDVAASELLRKEDPDPLELLNLALLGGPARSPSTATMPEVYEDGGRRYISGVR